MYLAHFGFTEWPFPNTPDPRFVYLSPRHEEALAHLLYGVRERGGFVQLTGEVGTGKTTTCRYLLSQLPEGVDVALVLNPMLTPEELLATVCDELGATYPADARTRKAFVDALYHHLLVAHARGRRTVVIVDEAQNLSPAALEQLRLLTNLETEREKLLQIILVGQPELSELLARNELRQVAQRVTARYHLLPFAERDTRAYIWRRLQIAGQRITLFEPGALAAVHRASRGVPRLINIVCDRALLGAYAQGRRTVSARIVRRAAREVSGRRASPGRRAAIAAAAAAVVVLTAAGVLLVSRSIPSLHEVWRLVVPTARATADRPSAVVAAVAPAADAAPATGSPAVALPADAGSPLVAASPPSPSAVTTDLPAVLKTVPPDDRAVALGRVLARWGVSTPAGDDPCRAASRAGLECFDGRGTWTVVRRLGLPVAIKLLTPDGSRHWAAVTALDPDAIVLELGTGTLSVPLVAAERLWDGVFSVVWRPLPGPARVLGPGTQGPAVTWLRRALSEAGVATSEQGPGYDEGLRASVVAFQRREGLEPDGVAGIETLVRLSTRLDRRAPLLSAAR